MHLPLLFWRRAVGLRNSLGALRRWEWVKRCLFGLTGLGILVGLFFGCLRVLRYMEGVELIGGLLTWKLTAMVLFTTLAMVAISNVLTAMTTLYYAADLPFLMSSPAPPRQVFFDKCIETTFYASWMVAVTLMPYILALGVVKHQPPGFYLVFVSVMLPYLALGAALGVFVCLTLMHLFPSSRTRDAVWVLSSLGMAGIYILIRFSEPERLVNPDRLEAVIEYLNFLQAPTAPYLPSWWMTQSLIAYTKGDWTGLLRETLKVYGGAALAYAGLVWLAGHIYSTGFSGSMEGARRRQRPEFDATWEEKLAKKLGFVSGIVDLYWKDRKMLSRDVRYWSQFLLILALVAVYVFSIWKLPIDTPDLKSLVCFFNIATSGFVVTALGLRFTFPAISLEGKGFWVVRAAPLTVSQIMREKFLFSVVPLLAMGLTLVSLSNYLLLADRFVTVLSTITIILACVTLCGMGIGFGAMFPAFDVENVHQIESSAGGFVYMASGLGYIGAVIAVEALPVQMHFYQRFGRVDAWDWGLVASTVIVLLFLNMAAFYVPWRLGQRTLEQHEF